MSRFANAIYELERRAKDLSNMATWEDRMDSWPQMRREAAEMASAAAVLRGVDRALGGVRSEPSDTGEMKE